MLLAITINTVSTLSCIVCCFLWVSSILSASKTANVSFIPQISASNFCSFKSSTPSVSSLPSQPSYISAFSDLYLPDKAIAFCTPTALHVVSTDHLIGNVLIFSLFFSLPLTSLWHLLLIALFLCSLGFQSPSPLWCFSTSVTTLCFLLNCHLISIKLLFSIDQSLAFCFPSEAIVSWKFYPNTYIVFITTLYSWPQSAYF